MLKRKLERIVKLLPDKSIVRYSPDILEITVGDSTYKFLVKDKDRIDRIIDVIEKNREEFKKKLDKDS